MRTKYLYLIIKALVLPPSNIEDSLRYFLARDVRSACLVAFDFRTLNSCLWSLRPPDYRQRLIIIKCIHVARAMRTAFGNIDATHYALSTRALSKYEIEY